MKEEINRILESAKKEIPKCRDLDALEELRIKYTGKKSELHSLLSKIGELPPEKRPEIGKALNITKKQNNKTTFREEEGIRANLAKKVSSRKQN